MSTVDTYTPRPNTRSTLDLITDAAEYLPTLLARLDALKDEPFDLILYNAGMDPYEGCDIGGLDGITDGTLASRDRMVFRWAQARQIPVAFVLAGGYVSDGLPQSLLVSLHRMTIRAALVTRPWSLDSGDGADGTYRRAKP